MAATQPLYERIERQLRRRLAGAEAGAPFPSEPQLATEFGVSRMTVRAALAGLERDGLIERIPGRGSFVRRSTAARPVGTLLSFHDQARAEGRTPRSRVLDAGLRPATAAEAEALRLPLDAPVVAISRIRMFDDLPVAIEHAVFPEALAPLLSADLETGSLHSALRDLGHDPVGGSSVLTAQVAGKDAPALGIDPETPLLTETRTITDHRGVPLEHTTSAYVAGRYALRVDFTITRPGPTGRRD